MKSSMLGLTITDRVGNDELRRRTGVIDVIERIARLKWNWPGHVALDQEIFGVETAGRLQKGADHLHSYS